MEQVSCLVNEEDLRNWNIGAIDFCENRRKLLSVNSAIYDGFKSLLKAHKICN